VAKAAVSAAVYRGSCENYRKLAPLQPFVQMLRQIFGIRRVMAVPRASAAVLDFLSPRGEQLMRHADTLLQLLSLRGSPQSQAASRSRQAITEALRDVFAALHAECPLVLVIDDWQWADELSHEVLHIVMRSITARGLLVLLGTREREQSDVLLSRAQVIELQPFQHLESTQVIHALRPDLLDVGLSRAIHQRSGGNPLFLEELCRTLSLEASTFSDANEHHDVPQAISSVICTGLEQMAPQALNLLRVAAVIGNVFSVQLLALTSGFPELPAALEYLVRCDFVRKADADGATYRFKHGITREVVYESVRLAERRRIHSMIASLLEAHSAAIDGGDESEALAYHHAGNGDHAKAAHYAELSGDKALAASSLDNARLHYGMALSELEKLPMDTPLKRRWLALSAKFGRVLVYNPRFDQLAVLKRSVQYASELDDTKALADVHQLCAFISYALGDYRSAIVHCREGLAVAARAGDHKTTAQLVSDLGQSLAASGRYPEALEHLDRSLQIKRERAATRPDRPLPIGFAYALACKALVHADQGEFHLAGVVMDEANQLMLRTGHAVEGSVLGLLGMTQVWQGKWEDCIATTSRAAETAERVTFSYVFAMSQVMSGYARFMLEASPQALLEVQRAVEWLELHERLLFVSFCYGCLAEMLWSSGQYERAREIARRALQRAQEHSDPLGEAVAYRVLAREFSRIGDVSATASALADAFRASDARESQRERALTSLLDAQLRYGAGERGALRETLQEVRLSFDQIDMLWHRSQAELLLARC
jgi:tetratricopeptide (TPR) repeat protein